MVESKCVVETEDIETIGYSDPRSCCRRQPFITFEESGAILAPPPFPPAHQEDKKSIPQSESTKGCTGRCESLTWAAGRLGLVALLRRPWEDINPLYRRMRIFLHMVRFRALRSCLTYFSQQAAWFETLECLINIHDRESIVGVNRFSPPSWVIAQFFCDSLVSGLSCWLRGDQYGHPKHPLQR
jgi:hypothetical protein